MTQRRRVIGFDTETFRFRPGVKAPELVCLTWHDEKGPGIVRWDQAEAVVTGWLRDPSVLLVAHNATYDAAVCMANFPETVPLWFAAYEADRVTDTMLRQKLLDIAAGKYGGFTTPEGYFVKINYTLADLARRVLGVHLAKEGTWRMNYSDLRDIPVTLWHPDAVEYAISDATIARQIWQKQETHADFLGDEYSQARADLACGLAAVYGLRTRKEGVDALENETLADLDSVRDELIAQGLVRPKGTRDTKAAKALMLKAIEDLRVEAVERYMAAGATPEEARERAEKAHPIKITKTALEQRLSVADAVAQGKIALDDDACKAAQNELLSDYADFGTLGAVLGKDVKALRQGCTYPIHTRFGLAASGRRTSSGPNVQNWRRRVGIRECFVPRAGHLFADVDVDQLELRTLAQCCLILVGHSKLAEQINSGIDPHTHMAAKFLRISYQEAIRRKKLKHDRKGEPQDPLYVAFDNARQTGKVANFGIPGGLGAPKLVDFARKGYGVILTVERAKELKAEWLAEYPEMREYFAKIAALCNNASGLGAIQQLFTKRVRGGCHYTALCNGYFQGLGADATMRGMWLLQTECYARPDSVLFGVRPVNYIHDQVISEVPDDALASERAEEHARVFIKGVNEYLPDVPATGEPGLMRYWSKNAMSLRGPDKRLIAWPA